MSKITLGEVVAEPFVQALRSLMAIPFPAKVSWRISKIVKGLQKEHDLYEEERLKALRKYAKLKKDKTIDFDDEGKAKFVGAKYKKFSKELKELQKQEVHVDEIPLSLLGNVVIEPHVFNALMDRIIFEKNKK